MGNHVIYPGFYEVILTNGVHERVTFVVHVFSEYDIINKLLTDQEHHGSPARPALMMES